MFFNLSFKNNTRIDWVMPDDIENPTQYIIFGDDEYNGHLVADWNGNDFVAVDNAVKSGSIEVRPSQPSHLHTIWNDGQWDVDLTAAWEIVRAECERLLSVTDKFVMPDHPKHSQAWLDYRQALRDVNKTQTDPLNIVWPEPPNA